MAQKTFTAVDNRRVKKAVKACRPVLEERLGLTKLIACGTQGCVYETDREGSVVKVTAGRHPEIDQIMWQKERGWRSHTALPIIDKRRVYRLNRCAVRAGVRGAYATVREDLADVPATKATRAAVTLLERLETKLFAVPGTYPEARAVMEAFCCRNEAALRRLHADPLGWMVWNSIAHLQMWLSHRNFTMSDVRLSNLGIRRPGLARGVPYDVVMRDIGYLILRSTARSRDWSRFMAGHSRAKPLGGLSDDLLDVLD